jgi:hypothetical protein
MCRLMPLVSLAVLACLGYVGFRLYYAPFMRQQWLYAVGALVVYWFSVSGKCACVRVSVSVPVSACMRASKF